MCLKTTNYILFSDWWTGKLQYHANRTRHSSCNVHLNHSARNAQSWFLYFHPVRSTLRYTAILLDHKVNKNHSYCTIMYAIELHSLYIQTADGRSPGMILTRWKRLETWSHNGTFRLEDRQHAQYLKWPAWICMNLFSRSATRIKTSTSFLIHWETERSPCTFYCTPRTVRNWVSGSPYDISPRSCRSLWIPILIDLG